MFDRCAALLLPLSLLTAACGPPGDGAVECGQLEPRNDDEIALCNGLDQAVIARVAVPEGDPPAGGWPGVVVLHGSGGLFVGADVCTDTLQEQFQTWVELLTSQGYAVAMPASFYSRGFCDWNEKRTVPRKLNEHERLVVRTYDGAAAANWLCDDPRVDCSRLALLGFSNGASTTLMLLHEDLSDAEDPRLGELADDIPAFAGGVAYYPGCGLQGELATSLDAEDVDRYYYPSAPVFVPHAGNDRLVENCEELRDPQVDVIADRKGVSEDRFEIEVYPGAEHGFDACEADDPQPDLDAHSDAQARALAKLDEWF